MSNKMSQMEHKVRKIKLCSGVRFAKCSVHLVISLKLECKFGFSASKPPCPPQNDQWYYYCH